MPKAHCLCKYCGREWSTVVYGTPTLKCSTCGDTRIRVRLENGPKVDYYEDDPKPREKIEADYAEDD